MTSKLLRNALLIAIAAASLMTPAQAEWRRATSKHFIVYSQGSANELKQSATALERYNQLLQLMSIAKPDEDSAPLTVFLVTDADHVGDLVNQHGAAGFYTVGPLGPVAVGARIADYNAYDSDFTAQVVLFHEYAHHYMLQNYTAAYPGWFVEGYAELLGATTFGSDGSAYVGNVAKYRLADLHSDNPIPIRDLLADDPDARKGRGVYAYYSEAWLLTHYLVFNDTRSPQLRRYLGLVSNGTKPMEAAVQAFGDLSKLVGEYNAYRNSPGLPGLHISQKNAPPIDEIRIETLDPAAQALVWDRLLYMRNLRGDEAASISADLAKRAAAGPGDIETLELLWRFQLAANDTTAADRTADALLALQPKDAQALLGKGLIAMKTLENAKDYTASRWAAARQYVISANEARTGNAETLFAYYQSFIGARQPPSQAAKLGLLRAFELEPQSNKFRLTLAASLIGDRRYSEARIVLKPAAFSVHDTGSAAWAQKMLGTIETLKDGGPPPMILPEIDKANDEHKSKKG
jgi:hypothetical protein